ncbi:pyrroline-5-carboxylate reductase [Phenylobacterium sp.]|uniref:pyrroline-5-carboxylate reductase n=1 Tax=Phenylobacterium sp. TaxID=1871053 RepID=UPI002F424886
MTPILLLGAGRMGGAILDGWAKAGAFAARDILIVDPFPSEAAKRMEAAGARLNPPAAALAQARTVILAVKPQKWLEAAAQHGAHLAPDAVIVSIAAGVPTEAISREFGGRTVARVMPNTAAAINRGTTSLYAADPDARARARALFAPLGAVVELPEEALIHAGTAVAGSGPAYLYAFVETLEAAGAAIGLSPDDAKALARSTVIGAAALLEASGEEPAELRRQVTSPAGTTEAAMNVLLGEHGLPPLMREAVAAAQRRSKELGG